MVIQRIQSLYLLVAAVLLCCFCFIVPVGSIPNEVGTMTHLYVCDIFPMLLLNCVVTILVIISIFLYKNLKLQMKVTKINIALLVASFVISGFLLCCKMPENAQIAWCLAAGTIILVLVLLVLALNRMKADYKLLRSVNTLR